MRKIGTIVSDIPPSIRGALIKLSVDDVRPLEYVVTYGEYNGRRAGIILRITDISHYSEFSKARALEIEEKMGIKLRPIVENGELLGEYLVAYGEVVDAFIVEHKHVIPIGPVIPPKPRSEVYKADDTVLRALIGNVKHPLYIGWLYGSPNVKVFLEANNLTRHMIILGGTGTGKSWFRGVVLEELHRLGIPQVNLDILDEYTDAVKQLGGKNLVLGRDYKPRLDMMSPDEFDLMIEDYIPTPFQRAIARQGFIRYRRASLNALQPLEPNQLLKYVNEAADEYNARADTRENTLSRLEAFLTDFGIFGTGIDWGRLLGKYKIVNIRFPYMADPVIRAGIAATLKELMYLRSRNAIPPLVVSFDEAHTIIPRGRDSPAKTVIKHLLRYGRHLGIGVIMITQRPSSIDEEAVMMPATRVIFAIDPRELKELKPLLSDLGDYAIRLIPRMETGSAVITATMDILRHSLYVKIRSDRKTRHGGHSIPLIQEGDIGT